MACFIPREFVPVAMFMLCRVVVVSLSLVVLPLVSFSRSFPLFFSSEKDPPPVEKELPPEIDWAPPNAPI